MESVELQHSFTSPVEHSGRQNESARRRVKSDGTQGERAAEVRVPGTDKWTGGGKTGSCLRQTSTVTTTIQVHSGGAPSLVPLEGFPLSPFEETTAPAAKQKHDKCYHTRPPPGQGTHKLLK